MALSHGSNDAQKTMGIIAMSLALYSGGSHAAAHFHVPLWVMVACAVAMGAGTMAGGVRIIKTMGTKIIDLKPVHGFAAETSAAVTILAASHLGLPVSTTHVISGAIMGVGSSQRVSAVRWGVTADRLGLGADDPGQCGGGLGLLPAARHCPRAVTESTSVSAESDRPKHLPSMVAARRRSVRLSPSTYERVPGKGASRSMFVRRGRESALGYPALLFSTCTNLFSQTPELMLIGEQVLERLRLAPNGVCNVFRAYRRAPVVSWPLGQVELAPDQRTAFSAPASSVLCSESMTNRPLSLEKWLHSAVAIPIQAP